MTTSGKLLAYKPCQETKISPTLDHHEHLQTPVIDQMICHRSLASLSAKKKKEKSFLSDFFKLILTILCMFCHLAFPVINIPKQLEHKSFCKTFFFLKINTFFSFQTVAVPWFLWWRACLLAQTMSIVHTLWILFLLVDKMICNQKYTTGLPNKTNCLFFDKGIIILFT